MNTRRVIAAAAFTVVPLAASSAALAAPAAPQGALAAAAAAPAQVTSEGTQYADTVLSRVNELRSSLNPQPVTWYQELSAVARDWSRQQAAASSMSRRPDFTSTHPSGWTTGSKNVTWRIAGGDTDAQVFNQWLSSPDHYKNMTDLDVSSISIGLARTSGDKWYATQNSTAYNVSNSTLTPSTTTTTNTTTTTTKSNTPPKTTDTPPADTTTPSPAPTPETTPSTPSTETTAPAPTAPLTSETITPTSTPSAPAVTVTTQTVTTTGTPAEPSATPVVAAPRTTLTKSALATTGPGIAVAVATADLLGTSAVLVMHHRQAS